MASQKNVNQQHLGQNFPLYPFVDKDMVVKPWYTGPDSDDISRQNAKLNELLLSHHMARFLKGDALALKEIIFFDMHARYVVLSGPWGNKTQQQIGQVWDLEAMSEEDFKK